MTEENNAMPSVKITHVLEFTPEWLTRRNDEHKVRHQAEVLHRVAGLMTEMGSELVAYDLRDPDTLKDRIRIVLTPTRSGVDLIELGTKLAHDIERIGER
jgi:hypothetical protein